MSLLSRPLPLAILASILGHAVLLVIVARFTGAAGAEATPSTAPLRLSLCDGTRVQQPTAAEATESEDEEPDFSVSVREAPTLSNDDPAPTPPQIIGSNPGHFASMGKGGKSPSTPGLLASPPGARRIAYLLDRSLSMGLSGAWQRARSELEQALQTLPYGAQFQVLVFNRTVEPLCGNGLQALNDSTRTSALQRLNALPPAGSTDHVAALRQALLLRPDVVYLITDEVDCSPTQIRTLTQLNAGQTVIHVVELNRVHAVENSPAKQLSQMNGGTFSRIAP